MSIRSLFQHYPALEKNLPWLSLAQLPTPIEKPDTLCTSTGHDQLYIKRDDLTNNIYGGNKIRKLEFLLAEAKHCGASRVITSGAAGSNHALATALYGKQTGLDVTLMLVNQEPNPSIAETLLADFASGATMILDPSYEQHQIHLSEIQKEYAASEKNVPYLIPPGGSSPLGTIGYVNAAFEISDQIKNGHIPEPAAVFAALGSSGTTVGLMLGFQAAGIKSSVHAVRVIPEAVTSRDVCRKLFQECNTLLHHADPSFPTCSFDEQRFNIIEEYLGDGYGYPTQKANHAIEIFRQTSAITLDPVYTGKAAAAFIAASESPVFQKKPLLFINTKSSSFPSIPAEKKGFHTLPIPFHIYFT